VERMLRDRDHDDTAGDVARDLPTLRAGQTLHDALGALLASETSGVPVLDDDGRTVIGWLTHADVLDLYRARAAGA
jgi:chloride channel protein, CIC family